MKRSIAVNKKSRGRPKTTGIGTLIGVRVQDDMLSDIDQFREAQFDRPNRPEAVRRLVEVGLDQVMPKKKR